MIKVVKEGFLWLTLHKKSKEGPCGASTYRFGNSVLGTAHDVRLQVDVGDVVSRGAHVEVTSLIEIWAEDVVVTRDVLVSEEALLRRQNYTAIWDITLLSIHHHTHRDPQVELYLGVQLYA
jgi:hypothetical protein